MLFDFLELMRALGTFVFVEWQCGTPSNVGCK
jgi:hypothetical protein